MELNELTKLLMLAAAAYGNRFETTDATAKVWFRYMKEFPLDAATTAFDAHIATQNWPPTPADIRKLIKEKNRLGAPSSQDAWDRCLMAAAGCGMNSFDEMRAAVRDNPVA